MVGWQPPSWSGFVHVNDRIRHIHEGVIISSKGAALLFIRGAAASLVKRCKNKNKNKWGNNFSPNECTQPLTVTPTRAVREKERERDRHSKTKGTWRLPILYFLCVTALRYSAEDVNASTSVNAFRHVAPVCTKFAGTYVRNQNETVHAHAVTFIS